MMKKTFFDSVNALYEGWKLTLNAFKRGKFPSKPSPGKELKIFTSKQMLQRLLKAPEQVKAGNKSENLLNEICQTIYFL